MLGLLFMAALAAVIFYFRKEIAAFLREGTASDDIKEEPVTEVTEEDANKV